MRGTLEGKSEEEDRDDPRVYMVSTRAQLTQRLICNLLICGADSRNRTRDLLITYLESQLSPDRALAFAILLASQQDRIVGGASEGHRPK